MKRSFSCLEFAKDLLCLSDEMRMVAGLILHVLYLNGYELMKSFRCLCHGHLSRHCNCKSSGKAG
jgi:hypothetical protein